MGALLVKWEDFFFKAFGNPRRPFTGHCGVCASHKHTDVSIASSAECHKTSQEFLLSRCQNPSRPAPQIPKNSAEHASIWSRGLAPIGSPPPAFCSSCWTREASSTSKGTHCVSHKVRVWTVKASSSVDSFNFCPHVPPFQVLLLWRWQCS